MKTTTNWEEELDLLLVDIFLKSNQHIRRYPLGQLKKRLGDYIKGLLAQQRSELLDQVEKEVEEAYRRGVETLAWRIDCNTLMSELSGWRNILEIAKEEALVSQRQKLSALRLSVKNKK